MARNIAANDDEAWRAVLVFKRRDNLELAYFYEGIYAKQGTAKGRISYWQNNGIKRIYDGPTWSTETHNTLADFYDGWPEKATISWDTVKD